MQMAVGSFPKLKACTLIRIGKLQHDIIVQPLKDIKKSSTRPVIQNDPKNVLIHAKVKTGASLITV